jgi:uncharacterized protein with HEPN domain
VIPGPETDPVLLEAVWLVVDQDLPPLATALARMIDRSGHED